MKKAIIAQILIFVLAWVLMTPDQLIDNTWVFGLFGSYDIIPGNSILVMSGAAVLSVLNIIIWWPKTKEVKVTNTSSEKESEGTKNEAKDPVVPKMD